MPKVAFFALFVFLKLSSNSFAQNCALSGTPGWSEQLRNVIADCDNRFVSPDGKLVLRIDIKGKIRVIEVASQRKLRIHSRAVEPPAMVSWSPNSDAFFVNDGEGSGMSSAFRLFRIRDSRIEEDGATARKAVVLYRGQFKCSPSAVDPNVWGMGWTPDGFRFHLLVQATVNQPCGEQGSFIGMTIKLDDGSVFEMLSEEATRRQFHTILPREVYSN